MKKLILLLTALLLVTSLSACGSGSESDSNDSKLVVAATLDPHAKILEFAKEILKEDYQIDLEIEVLDDYYVFNKALDSGEVDANYFQHLPFFENDVKENEYDLVNVAGIHIEPFGFYSKTISDLSELQDGSTVVISNSISDHGRILAILAKANIIELDSNVSSLDATIEDITSNPKNLVFTEVKPELLTLAFEQGEGDLVAINGNYAIQANLNPITDSVLLEQADSSNPYVNIVACKKGDENSDKIKALVEVLKSDEVKDFIRETYSDGSVIPAE